MIQFTAAEGDGRNKEVKGTTTQTQQPTGNATINPLRKPAMPSRCQTTSVRSASPFHETVVYILPKNVREYRVKPEPGGALNRPSGRLPPTQTTTGDLPRQGSLRACAETLTSSGSVARPRLLQRRGPSDRARRRPARAAAAPNTTYHIK